MKPLQYAVVAYVRNNPVGSFVEDLRRELHPDHGHLPAHVTVLPPRLLQGSEEAAIAVFEQRCRRLEAFQARMGEVETFCPATPTVYIRVSRSAYKFRDLHDELNVGPLYCEEQWPYMPHLTIVKMPEMAGAKHALAVANDRWAKFPAEKIIPVEEITFVREMPNNCWADLMAVSLCKADMISGKRK